MVAMPLVSAKAMTSSRWSSVKILDGSLMRVGSKWFSRHRILKFLCFLMYSSQRLTSLYQKANRGEPTQVQTGTWLVDGAWSQAIP